MAVPPQQARDGPEDLLPLALSRPNDAFDRARAVLAAEPTPYAASMAHQAIGLVLREFGDIDASVRELQTARRLARLSGSADREVDVLGTLGVALVLAGRTQSGRNALNEAANTSTGRLHGRSLFRRGAVLHILGHHREALTDLNRAIAVLRAVDDSIWQARALTERAFTHLALGGVHRAAADLQRAEALFVASGQELESVDATAHRGLLALRLGDLPAALTCFDDASERFEKLDTMEPGLSLNRCEALLAAGLPDDAVREADRAITRLERIHGQPTKRAELLLMAATSALAAGQHTKALERATEAARLFHRQGRGWWRVHARLVQLRAGFAAGPPTLTMLRDAHQCVDELVAVASPDVPLARLTAGRVALAVGYATLADEHLTAAAVGRHRGPALSRAVAWLSEALRGEAAGDRRRVMHACRSGLNVLDEHRSILGSSELLAQTTAHGAEMANLGQRHALQLGRARQLLSWSERWRAIALAVPAVRPSDDAHLQADLASVRDVTRRLARSFERGLPTAKLARDQQRLEQAIRARAMRTFGATAQRGSHTRPGDFDVGALLDELGNDRLLELVDVDGALHVLVCGAGRVRRFAAAPTARVSAELDFARFGLTRIAYGRSAHAPTDALEILTRSGELINQLVLGEARRHLGDGPMVIVPPGRLQAVPWSLLPDLRERAVSVAPSATTWLRARRARGAGDSDTGRVVLVRGPGLASQGAEVPQLAAAYRLDDDDLVVLENGTATAARVLSAMDGARLVHIAAHGTFRADSPMFSALVLDDGPLTVYDLQRMHRGPRQIVLSSCDSGAVAPAGADEVLGLASSLIPLGTAGIVASVVAVNDDAAVPLMTALHQRLRSGAGLAEALCQARHEMSSDPVASATALSFIALGAG